MPRAFLIKNKKQPGLNGGLPGQESPVDSNILVVDDEEKMVVTREERDIGDQLTSSTHLVEDEDDEIDVEEEDDEDSEKVVQEVIPNNAKTPSEMSGIFMIANLKNSHKVETNHHHRPSPFLDLHRLPYRFSPMMISPDHEPGRGDSPVSSLPGEKGSVSLREVPRERRMCSPPVDQICIYPSPSPSSEEHVTCDDASTSSDDDHRDLTRDRNRHDVSNPIAIIPKKRLTSSLHPEMRWTNHVAHFQRHPGFPSPGTSPEPEASSDKGLSPKRRRSDESVSSSSLSVSPPRQDTPAAMHLGDVSPDVQRHQATSGETFWPNSGMPGLGLSLSMSAHHPYLALSFQRLQQMHLRAAQEGLSKYPHLSPLPLTPLGSLSLPHLPPFAPIPPGSAATLPLPPSPSPARSPGCGLARRPLSPSPPVRSDDYNPAFSSSRVERLVDYPSHAMSQAMANQVTPATVRMTTTSNKAPEIVTRGESLPLDLDTKSAAEKRKRREGEPPRYNCESCGKSYSTFSGLSKHKQFHCTSHVQKQFNCKYCDKTYVSLGALKMHIRTHTLPCKCHLCGKAFSRPWLLQGHVRTHTGEKPFQCSHCGRSFADRSNLRAHLQTHSDVKKYSCRSCSKTFSRMSLLLKHEDGGCAGGAHS